MRLPVRTTLLQNAADSDVPRLLCDYQSERHCSKTAWQDYMAFCVCDYQSERHCSKTALKASNAVCSCDYQSERHCSKTRGLVRHYGRPCDYQSERHCSKTAQSCRSFAKRAITSQNDTAPKRLKCLSPLRVVRLPVRTTLLQNRRDAL